MKTLALAAVFTTAAVATATAQGPRPFRDSWFWGVHGGLASYTASDPVNPSARGTRSFAPQAGVDWLITRKTGGLYMSFGQAFVTTTGSVLNGPTSADTGYRTVDVKDLRRFNLAAMAFPGDFIRLHPYVGAGFAFGYLAAAQAQFSTTDTQRQVDYAASAVNDVKAGIGPVFIAGAQYRLPLVSTFGQFTASALSKDFLLANGKPIAFAFEFGLRYNIGSSIDRQF
ncbi:MAG TPA: hypothetical protein VFO55_10055 [Gemmatimonadaceae bacterium]|nr:hypothetical protein [Gemmatimonadaceae bacterium]